jgi:hypothetical protein
LEVLFRVRKLVLFVVAGFVCSIFASAQAEALVLESSAFGDGEMMPKETGYRNGNVSPALFWEDVPEGVKSFALVMDDPDAHGWTHWLVYNIPPGVRTLPGNFPAVRELADGTRQGINDFKKIGYGGPSPPGGIHRYVFRLFALDAKLDLAPGASKASLLESVKGHILAQARLVGRYGR